MGAGGEGGQVRQRTQLPLDNMSKRERVERLEHWRMESSSMSGSGETAEERADKHWTRSLCAAKGTGPFEVVLGTIMHLPMQPA